MRYLPCLMLIGAACAPLHAQPDLTLDWCTVGDPGNRDTTIEETAFGFNPGVQLGRVDYAYRILETELTVEQQFEFVRAYYPIYAKRKQAWGTVDFTGFDIDASFAGVHIHANIDPQRPGSMSWEYYARYCNWLHHGMVNEPWAFDSGAYDTSTFYEDPPGVWHHQAARSPGARYWIPSADEWTKAAHWDPTLDDGQGGYWLYPTRSNADRPPGFPSEGGERNAGYDDAFPIAVRSYPGITSYYGLYDLAGGRYEMAEDTIPNFSPQYRLAFGSQYWDVKENLFEPLDRLGFTNSLTVNIPRGMRPAGTEFASSDLNQDGRTNYFDISMFLQMYLHGDMTVDLRKDNGLDIDDVRVFIGLYTNNL